jgi:hypothetical protein
LSRKQYVVTSDHIIKEEVRLGDPGFEHTVSLIEENGDWERSHEEKDATYVASDSGIGLALLEVKQSLNHGLVQGSFGGYAEGADAWVDLKESASFQCLQNVLIEGVPFASNSILRDRGGEIVTKDSKYAYYPLSTPLVELEGVHGEFGMSGSPVWVVQNRDRGRQLVGLLSHQAITPDSRGAFRVTEWRQGEKYENRVLVIPGYAVLEWVNEYLRNPTGFRPYYLSASGADLGNGAVVQTGTVKLTMACKDHCSVDVRPRENRKTELKYQFTSLSQMGDTLDRGGAKAFTIRGFRAKDKIEYFTTSREFYIAMKQVQKGKAVPIVTKDDATGAAPVATLLSQAITSAVSPKARSLQVRLGALRAQADSEAWWELRLTDLDEILSGSKYRGDWKDLSPAQAEEVRRQVQAARDELSKLVL